MLTAYLENIFDTARRGDAREESYYGTLGDLLNDYGATTDRKNIHITTLPKKTEAGNPDFRIWNGKEHIVGYIEAKAPTVENLDRIEGTEQLKRYLGTFPNLLLTNFFEFRLYRNGLLVHKAAIARPFIFHQLNTVPPVEHREDFMALMETFFSFSLPKVYTAKTLAVELAKRTRFLRDEVLTEEIKEEAEGHGFILGFYEAFRKYLISGLTKEGFTDLYSQTITYGLFAARTRSQNGFNRKLAYDSIPQTIGILREVFRFVSLGDVPPQMEWIIDDIAEVLAVTDVNRILHQFYREGKGKDPIVHFYETFLAEYDPATREKRGVYYTPEPVVSYIVRSVHHILKDTFGKNLGLAEGNVTLLDPAAGTLTFIAEAAKLAMDEFTATYGEGGKERFIREHILENFYAFELMMAPYAVGHLKMSFLLEELGYQLGKEDRLKLYLTNTLEMEELEQTDLPGMASLSEESHLAGKVKKEAPILVILGNPPYSGASANKSEKEITLQKGQKYTAGYQIWEDGNKHSLVPIDKKATKEIRKKQKTWIGALMEYYKIIDGRWLDEKNPKWLQDDYVKFIRFGQWKIDQAGEGVLAFITNHSYLDNPTFRGMRQSLMKSFNEIYILDLHGNSLKKETCPDGSKDENVFDIRQGVAIALCIKTKDNTSEALVSHAEVWGTRGQKNEWLQAHDVTTTQWRELSPHSEFYLFIPRNEELLKNYNKWPKINNIFPINSVGIVTARDRLTIQWTPEQVWTTVLNFSKMDHELARTAYHLGDDARDWKVELAQKDLRESDLDREKIVPILYRPFDIRYTYYTGKSRGFHCMPRPEVMSHMMQENMGLYTCRQISSNHWQHILPTIGLTDDCYVSNKTRERGYLFPLYLYPNSRRKDLLSELEKEQGKQPNINTSVLLALKDAYGTQPEPEEIFHYIYAILYSTIYRGKYAEFLKTDFPRVPFTEDHELFLRMSNCGASLSGLHLLQSPDLNASVAKFQGCGDNSVEFQNYEVPTGRIYINAAQYFEGVSRDVWNYQIGGYQVCGKWLKDRKSRTLSLDDIRHYCKVITALYKSIEIQDEIDSVYDEVEKHIIK